MVENRDCPICNAADRSVDANKRAFAIHDAYPMIPGHILIILQFKGDHPRPRGRIRNVLLWTGHGARRTGDPPQG